LAGGRGATYCGIISGQSQVKLKIADIPQTDFVELTEIAGDDVAQEQVDRICRRYYWAGEYCRGNDVLEVACGTGQGVGFLKRIARSLSAGDYSEAILAIARRHYGDRFSFDRFDAKAMPYGSAQFDAVIIFEAIYYLADLDAFFSECRRVLRPGGVLLIATANKDLYDFTPSAHSYRYLGVSEMRAELESFGFTCEFFGDSRVTAASTRQKLLRPVKMMASRLGLIPKSMSGKKMLKKLFFGRLVKMPAEITEHTCAAVPPDPIPADRPNTTHKVLFCAARLHS
jgi:SAM-dependent methyltransferase